MSLNYTISIPANFHCPVVNSLCPQPQLPQTSTIALNTHVDAATVSEWLRKFNNSFSRFERIASHGLYSILEKEIQNITPLLSDGQKISRSPTHYSGISIMINDLVKPRLIQLQTAYTAAQKKLVERPKEKEKDVRLAQKWEELGLSMSVLENHADCARFLIESGLAFAIVGYRESCRNPDLHDLKLDRDGHPMLKMQGIFRRWEAIAKELEYDPDSNTIKSRGNTAVIWNYFHPNGLVSKDRFTYDRVYPIYQLPQTEYESVLRHAKKFYETNPEIDLGILKDCVVQFYTNPRRQGISHHPLLENLHRNIPVHVGIRLITANGEVYSFGFQMSHEEQSSILTNLLSNYLKTGEAKISMLDYEEFRKHEGRIVTSIPLTSLRCRNILNYLSDMNQKHLRFQYIRQNCSNLALDVLEKAGYEVDIRTTVAECFSDLLPNFNQFPIIGPLIAKVEQVRDRIWATIPKSIGDFVDLLKSHVFFLPKKGVTFLCNLLIWKLGAWKMTRPLSPGVEDERFDDRKKLQNFSSVIRSWSDLFKEEPTRVYHSKNFIDWQKRQKSTFIEPYSGRPKLSIVPSQ